MGNEQNSKADQILKIIFELQNAEKPLCPPSGAGSEYHRRKLLRLMEQDLAIQLVLPAFPAKSSNPHKTLGTLPDYGEVIALKRLNELCIRISDVDSKAANLVICSDGRVFSDLVQVTDRAVDEYSQGIRDIISNYGLTHLSTYDLDDVIPPCQGRYDQMRELLVNDYAEPLETIKARVRNDENAKFLFNGIHRFLFEDQLVTRPDRSKTQIRESTKELAYSVIQRSNAWSALVAENFPSAIRLSIHPQSEDSEKIGVRLLPSVDRWRTPWHAAALFDGKQFVLVRRKDAEDMRAVLHHEEGKYPYFVAPEVLHAAV